MPEKLIAKGLILALLCFMLASCGIYKQNIMFKPEQYPLATLTASAEKNYKIQPNDWIELQVFDQKGERAIDFNINTDPSRQINTNRSSQTGQPRYLVQANGTVDLPRIGNTYLKGYTLHQADSVLAKAFSEYYVEPYVITRYVNKRVTVLGTINQVVPLNNENMTVMEVLAMAGGINNTAKVKNIRLLRGDLNNNPEVYLINLSTVEGMKHSQLFVKENDIIYVEPVRKTFVETFGDVSPILGLVTSLVTLVVFLTR
jgi:polysaccharide export outer membrane protein